MQINGLAAVVAIPGLSVLHVSTAAQLALTRALIAEANSDSPRITALLIADWVRSRSRQQLPPDALSAREVGEAVAGQILTAGPSEILTLGKPGGTVTVARLDGWTAGPQAAQDVLDQMESAGERPMRG